MELDPANMTLEELKMIHDDDNINSDCDCEYCRYYRQLLKEKE